MISGRRAARKIRCSAGGKYLFEVGVQVMRRPRYSQKKFVVLFLVGLAALIGYILKNNPMQPAGGENYVAQTSAGGHDYNNILVTRVVDGDTLMLESREYLRLLGIDTPEMHESAKMHRDAGRTGQSIEEIQRMGRQSYEFTRGLVEGKRVRLEFDNERRDKYNRMLAYVFLEDGTFVNARIVEEGYASLTNFKLNAEYMDLFRKLYRQARENRRGLWK